MQMATFFSVYGYSLFCGLCTLACLGMAILSFIQSNKDPKKEKK